jgi:hypothetical protein
MPPVTALKNVVNLINCQIAYLLTLWKHDAVLPVFERRVSKKRCVIFLDILEGNHFPQDTI